MMFNNSISFFLILFFSLIHLRDCANTKQNNQEFSKELCECDEKIEIKNPNGNLMKRSELAFVVSIFLNYSDSILEHACSGVILNPSLVLSAASDYCVKDEFVANSSALVAAGSIGPDHDLLEIYKSIANFRKISKIYNKGLVISSSDEINNIAIYELSSPFELGHSTQIYPACLLRSKKEYEYYHEFLTVSYGKHDEEEWAKFSKLDHRTRINLNSPDVESIRKYTKLRSYKLYKVKPFSEDSRVNDSIGVHIPYFSNWVDAFGSPALEYQDPFYNNIVIGILGKNSKEQSVDIGNGIVMVTFNVMPLTLISDHFSWIQSIATDNLCVSK